MTKVNAQLGDEARDTVSGFSDACVARTERDQLVQTVKEAQAKNSDMQEKVEFGSAEWHLHETVDDKLHDALTLLGD